jgi:hypothetical protein
MLGKRQLFKRRSNNLHFPPDTICLKFETDRITESGRPAHFAPRHATLDASWTYFKPVTTPWKFVVHAAF